MNNWKSVKCLVEGSNHGVDGTPCQDYVDIVEDGNAIIAVLSDGLGSKRHSEIASKSIVDIVSGFLQKHFEAFNDGDVFRKQFIDTCRQAIMQSANIKGLRPEDMDCTLLFVAIRGNEMVIGQLGDGAVCILNKNSGQLFCVPQKGSVANTTMTVFSNNAIDSLRIQHLPDIGDIEAIILTSDGLESDFYYPNSKTVRKMAGVYANAVANEKTEKATEILTNRIKSLQNAGADDDVSIAVLSRAHANIELPDDPTWLCVCGCRNGVDITHCSQCQEDFIDVYSDMDFSRKDKVAFLKSFNGTDRETQYIKNKKTPQPEREDPVVVLDKAICDKQNTQVEYEENNPQRYHGFTEQPPYEQPPNRREYTTQACQQGFNNGEERESVLKGGNTQPQGNKSKVKKIFSTILICLLGVVLGAMAAAIGINMSRPRTEQIDYNKLAQATYELYQSQPNNSATQNSTTNVGKDDTAQKLDDIYLLLAKSQQSSGNGQSPSLYADFDASLYRKLIKDLVEKYGKNGVLVSGNSGYAFFRDGSCYTGVMAQSLPNGKGMLFLADWTTLIGNFKNGQKEGKFLSIGADGKVSQVVYSNDKLKGGE